jgi:sulfite reductase (NADPH) flavoprotein alpha-component
MALRPTVRLLHRWLGLSLGLLLVLIGLSGSLLVFNRELDGALNAPLFQNRAACAAPIDADAAVARLQQHWPQARVSTLTLPQQQGGSYRLQFKAPGVAFNEAMLDACSGELLGARDREALALDRAHLMPLLQRWHTMLLQGKAGRTALGYLALIWFAMLLGGLLLAWPLKRGLAGWKRVLSVKLNQSALRSHFDLHRAAGLLAVPLMLVTAFTGFYNGLPELMRSAVGQVAQVAPEHRRIALEPLAASEDAISWNAARAAAAPYLVDGVQLLALNRQPERGLFQARLLRADDWQRTGTLRVFIDLRDGKVIDVVNPLAGQSGDRFIASLFPLHSGQLGGAAGRVIVALSGLLPALFFITGISAWILRRKRKSI